MNTIQSNNKVITSKGRFGKIKSTDGIKSIVTIGKHDFEIYNTELILLDNFKSVQVTYCRESLLDDIENDVIWINKKSLLYDFNKPLDNDIHKQCQITLCKKLNIKKVIILTINLV